MIYTQFMQTILIHIISFKRYHYENQDYKSLMNRCSAKLHYSIAVLLFVVLPVFNILVYLTMLVSGAESGILFSYLTFYATLSTLILISFLTVLLDDFEELKWEHNTYMRHRKEAKESLNQGFEFDGSNN